MGSSNIVDRLRARVSALQSGIAKKNTVSPAELNDTLELLAETIRQLERRSIEQSRLEDRISRIENSLLFRSLRGIGLRAQVSKRKIGQALLKSPLHPLYLKLVRPVEDNSAYEDWLRCQDANTPSWQEHREQAQKWSERPTVSVVMATHNPNREWLDAAVNSVLAQSYPLWEMGICDDASESWVADYLKEKSQEDARIRYRRSAEPLGISGAFNRAGQLVRGDYVAFLDHDDLLSPVALHYVVESLQNGPADIIYTDEDHIDPSGRLRRPSLKPAWSPDLLSTCMYIGHLLVVSRSRMDEIGWFRTEYDGAQDYDAVLRITDRPATVVHVPRILYHWRQHPGSTAMSPSAKSYTHDAGRKALEDAVVRRGWDAEVSDGAAPNAYKVTRKLIAPARVSFIICSRNAELLERCLNALEQTSGVPSSQTVVVQHKTGDQRRMEQVLKDHRCHVVPFRGEFNFAAMNNLGAAASTGDFLVFLNDDVVPLSADWVGRLAAQLQRPEVGVVGAKLLYPSGAIQHAGLVVGMMDGAGHPGRALFRSDLWPWLDQTRNVSAVTGACMGIRRRLFKDLGGFDEAFPVNYNDVDLCLQARRAGYEVIFEARAVLRHDECQSRAAGTRIEERDLFHERWAEVLRAPDPYFSPLLSTATEEIELVSGSASADARTDDISVKSQSAACQETPRGASAFYRLSL